MVKLMGSDLVINKKAFHNYTILEKLEAGLQLVGTEVKSCRAQAITMTDSYAQIINGEMYLRNVSISHYSHGNLNNHQVDRDRKLLLHKKEIARLKVATEAKGLTIVPVKFYMTRGKVKVQLGICKGKNAADKRNTVKNRMADIDARRAMKNY